MIPRSRSALAWRLAAVGIALGVLFTAQIGRNGCLRHGVSGAAIGTVEAAIDATPVDHGPEGAHAACPLCTAAPIGASTAPPVAIEAPAVAIAIAATSTPYVGTARVAGPPLRYAPKTSPPVA